MLYTFSEPCLFNLFIAYLSLSTHSQPTFIVIMFAVVILRRLGLQATPYLSIIM